MLTAYRRATTARIGTLVNTHQNGDHWFGNALVEDAEIIATERAASAMAHETPALLDGFMKAAPSLGLTGEYVVHCFGRFDFEHAAHKLPDTTFSGRLTKHVGNKAVELIEVGPAHTGGDALVWVRSDRIVFTGDILFIDGHPILWAGPMSNWIAACEMIQALNAQSIVPGHGPVTDAAGVERVRDYLVYIRDEARKRFDASLGAFEAARSIALDDFEGWGDAERIAVNVATLYREFGDDKVPADAATLFGWMAQLWKDRRK